MGFLNPILNLCMTDSYKKSAPTKLLLFDHMFPKIMF